MRIELQALAAALEQWPAEGEIWGTARDASGRAALVHGVTRGRVLIIDEPVVLDPATGDVVRREGVRR